VFLYKVKQKGKIQLLIHFTTHILPCVAMAKTAMNQHTTAFEANSVSSYTSRVSFKNKASAFLYRVHDKSLGMGVCVHFKRTLPKLL
jgi:hypothetical protein